MTDNACNHYGCTNSVHNRLGSKRIPPREIAQNRNPFVIEDGIYKCRYCNQRKHIDKICYQCPFTFLHHGVCKSASQRYRKTHGMHKKATEAYHKQKIYEIYNGMIVIKFVHCICLSLGFASILTKFKRKSSV